MKDLLKFEQGVGGDGGKVAGSVGVDQSDLVAQVQVRYPLAKVVEPATSALDKLLDKLKAAIPGSWDDALIDKFKAEYKEDLVELLSEKPAIAAPEPVEA